MRPSVLPNAGLASDPSVPFAASPWEVVGAADALPRQRSTSPAALATAAPSRSATEGRRPASPLRTYGGPTDAVETLLTPPLSRSSSLRVPAGKPTPAQPTGAVASRPRATLAAALEGSRQHNATLQRQNRLLRTEADRLRQQNLRLQRLANQTLTQVRQATDDHRRAVVALGEALVKHPEVKAPKTFYETWAPKALPPALHGIYAGSVWSHFAASCRALAKGALLDAGLHVGRALAAIAVQALVLVCGVASFLRHSSLLALLSFLLGAVLRRG